MPQGKPGYHPLVGHFVTHRTKGGKGKAMSFCPITNTFMVLWERGGVKKVPENEIDEYQE